MLGVGQKLPDFKIIGVKPGFNSHEENGVSAFEPVTQDSFEGKWKVIFFSPKDFTFVCPTEIAEFASLARDFDDRDTVVGAAADHMDMQLGGDVAEGGDVELLHGPARGLADRADQAAGADDLLGQNSAIGGRKVLDLA